MKELKAFGLANVVQALVPETRIWIKVREKSGAFKTYPATAIEPMESGSETVYCIVADVEF